MDTVIYSVSLAAIAFGVALAFNPLDKRLTLVFCFLFAIYIGLDDFVTGLPGLSGLFNVLPGQWNWEGKIYSFLLSFAVILLAGINPQSVGLTLAQKKIKASIITCLLYMPWVITLGLIFKPSISVETMFFQATMPALAEELAYRGVAPALLLGLIRGKQPQETIPWAVVFISAIMFGVWHGLGYSDGSFSFEVAAALITGLGGGIACWLRFNSGSMLFPVLLHGLANVVFHLTALVGT